MKRSPPKRNYPPKVDQPDAERPSMNLAQTQRLMAQAIMRPLTPDQRMQPRWTDDQPTSAVVETFIKPNDRLTSFERLEIYNRQYWFRLLDCLYDDFPGLRAILGQDRFYDLSVAYLEQHPSRSYTLRNLGSQLEQFLRQNPRWTRPHTKLVLDMARFEWAQVLAFDEAALPPLTPDDLLGRDPATLQLHLQPHVSLLQLSYPLDEFLSAVKKEQHGETSNAAPEETPEAFTGRKSRRTPLPARKKTHLAVHRADNALYFKRLEPRAYQILLALQQGQTLHDAVAAAFDPAPRSWSPEKIASTVRRWFHNWTAIGWFTRPQP